jgi:hypothetical protein
MSPLAMILTAAMTVPGIGPEQVSGEVQEPRLDLSGEWEGVYFNSKEKLSARLADGFLTVTLVHDGGQSTSRLAIQFADDGGGKLRVGMFGNPPSSPGSYRQARDGLVIIFEGNQVTLTLHRVKPTK